jgi:hypothetical protein
MKRIIVVVILAVLAWQVYARYERTAASVGANAPRAGEQGAARLLQTPQQAGSGSALFKCDGRRYCSQMTSCAEATYFLKNCPGVKMDGNNDGIPCEKQWCK